MRKKYNDVILTKKNRGPLEKLYTANYLNIDEVDKTKVQEVNDLFVEKEKKKEVLSKILNVIWLKTKNLLHLWYVCNY